MKDLDTLDDFNKAIKTTIKNKINYKRKNDKEIELKSSKTDLGVKKYFFKQLPSDGWGIYSYILNKRRVNDYLRTTQGKHKLYNYIAGKLIEKLSFTEEVQTVNLVIDRSKAPKQIEDFNQYLKNLIESKIPLKAAFNISHLKSELSPGIQACDLFCGGLYKKHTRNDESWYKEFKDKIFFEDVYLE